MRWRPMDMDIRIAGERMDGDRIDAD